MTCVIVNHSKISSFVTWFSYERFWIVTSAEVFVVLSGVVLGMVYGRRLAKSGWEPVVRGLTRRALTLYLAFIAVTLSVVVLSLTGVDVHALADGSGRAADWFLDPRGMDIQAWRDLVLMRSGPWPFEIVALYVWLVAAALPCLAVLRLIGWRPLLAASWALYLAHRIAPGPLTGADFEEVFPILAWQLLFAHGIAIGYHREALNSWVVRHRTTTRRVLLASAVAAMAFMTLAMCNPWADGPSWLHWSVMSPERFAYVYDHYFSLSKLELGRLVNLAVGLPLGYALLASLWTAAQRLQAIFVTLGQQSLGAFILHVYGILITAQFQLADSLWLNAAVQTASVVAIAGILQGLQRRRRPVRETRETQEAHAQPLAA